MRASEIAVNFWREGLSGDGILGRVDYKVGEAVPTNLPEWSNAMNNITRLITSKMLHNATD